MLLIIYLFIVHSKYLSVSDWLRDNGDNGHNSDNGDKSDKGESDDK